MDGVTITEQEPVWRNGWYNLGTSRRTESELIDFMNSIHWDWKGRDYNFLSHNCFIYANTIIQFLLGEPIPVHMTIPLETVAKASIQSRISHTETLAMKNTISPKLADLSKRVIKREAEYLTTNTTSSYSRPQSYKTSSTSWFNISKIFGAREQNVCYN